MKWHMTPKRKKSAPCFRNLSFLSSLCSQMHNISCRYENSLKELTAVLEKRNWRNLGAFFLPAQASDQKVKTKFYKKYQALDPHSHWQTIWVNWTVVSQTGHQPCFLSLGQKAEAEGSRKCWGILVNSNLILLRTLSHFLYHRDTHERSLKQADIFRYKPFRMLDNY